MLNAIKKFWQEEEGLTAIEYVICAGLLVAGLTVLFTNMGTNLDTKLAAIVNSIT
jgi:pilus assembly protein Flp/PilA